MRRRDFVRGIAGAIGWPIVARAQQPDRQRRVGVLLPIAKDDPEYQPWIAAFRRALQELGWVDGRNIRIDIHWATTNPAEIRRQAAELVALAPDVILAPGTSTVGALTQATRTVPIVFPIIADPVAGGDPTCAIATWGIATILIGNTFTVGPSPVDAQRAQDAIDHGPDDRCEDAT